MEFVFEGAKRFGIRKMCLSSALSPFPTMFSKGKRRRGIPPACTLLVYIIVINVLVYVICIKLLLKNHVFILLQDDTLNSVIPPTTFSKPAVLLSGKPDSPPSHSSSSVCIQHELGSEKSKYIHLQKFGFILLMT